MSEQVVAVAVEILDKEYTIACPPSEREGLLESARMLGDRLRGIRDSGKVMGTERMVIITALNLIHELTRQQRTQSELHHAMESDIRRLQEKVGNAIAECR